MDKLAKLMDLVGAKGLHSTFKELTDSKKAMVVLLILAAAYWMVAKGQLTMAEWKDLAKYLGTGWLVAQGASDYGKAKNGGGA